MNPISRAAENDWITLACEDEWEYLKGGEA